MPGIDERTIAISTVGRFPMATFVVIHPVEPDLYESRDSLLLSHSLELRSLVDQEFDGASEMFAAGPKQPVVIVWQDDDDARSCEHLGPGYLRIEKPGRA